MTAMMTRIKDSQELEAGPDTDLDGLDQLATFAHELRDPLSLLTMNLDSILFRIESVSAADASMWLRDRLEMQRRGVRRMRLLADNLLESSQLARGRPQLRRERFDLCQVTADELTAEDDSLKAGGCSCVVDAPESVFGFWDRTKIAVAIRNLIANAIKYGVGRPIELVVGAGERRAWVQVRDYGSGVVDGHEKARIFGEVHR